MIVNYIQQIIQSEIEQGSNTLYIRSRVKEYLQVLILYFIYTEPRYKSNLIFTGGTCLRHLFGLERLSEDLDFDLIDQLDTKILANDIGEYFKSRLLYKDLDISIKQQGRQILLKFPILNQIGLADKGDSDLLYIKLDIAQAIGTSYKIQRTAKSAFGYNFVALHYDLPSLFAGKIIAILTRNLFIGKENREIIKGRDFYDLLWYLKKESLVNLQLVREKLNDPNLTIEALQKLVGAKATLASTKYRSDFQNDLLPFISSPIFIADYVNNYLDEFGRYELKAQDY